MKLLSPSASIWAVPEVFSCFFFLHRECISFDIDPVKFFFFYDAGGCLAVAEFALCSSLTVLWVLVASHWLCVCLVFLRPSHRMSLALISSPGLIRACYPVNLTTKSLTFRLLCKMLHQVSVAHQRPSTPVLLSESRVWCVNVMETCSETKTLSVIDDLFKPPQTKYVKMHLLTNNIPSFYLMISPSTANCNCQCLLRLQTNIDAVHVTSPVGLKSRLSQVCSVRTEGDGHRQLSVKPTWHQK